MIKCLIIREQLIDFISKMTILDSVQQLSSIEFQIEPSYEELQVSSVYFLQVMVAVVKVQMPFESSSIFVFEWTQLTLIESILAHLDSLASFLTTTFFMSL